MSWKALFIVVAFAIVGWPRASHAEKVKTNQPTKLYSRAGEQAPVLLKVKEGQTMTVLAKDGRWIKVRVQGRTGWVPRSKVDMPEGDEIARNTRRRPFVDGRGTKRGFGGEGGPDDRVGADATGEGVEEPEPRPTAKAPAEDEDDEKPAKKPARPEKAEKPVKKPDKKAKPADDEDVVSVDDDEPAAKAGKKHGDDEEPAAKASKGDDEAEDKKDGDDEAKPPARPTAHVAKATVVRSDPSAESEEAFTAQPKVALYVGEEKGKWTFVENDDGDAGYVLTSKLEREDAEADAGPRARSIDLRGRIGLARIARSVSQAGGMPNPPDNYSTGGASVTLSLGAEALYPYKDKFWVGGEFNYDLDKSLAGVTYKDESTGITYHNFNLRAEGGYDLQNAKAMVVFARLGLHYESFQVENVADLTINTATLPSQNITGPTIGAALAIGRLTPKLALRLNLDAMLLSSVTQTKNLEDGTGGSAKAVYLGGRLTYHWKPSLDLQGILDVGYTSLGFSGPPPDTSQRKHMGMGNVSSSDLLTTLTVGVSYRL
jgi:uncharacterized protein YgiM (DUF1202 family)